VKCKAALLLLPGRPCAHHIAGVGAARERVTESQARLLKHGLDLFIPLFQRRDEKQAGELNVSDSP
jgi:hypothetical protein